MKETIRKKAGLLLFKPFGKKFSLAFFLLCPIVSFYLLELFIHNPFADIHFGLHLFSWLLYLLFYGICFFLTGRLNIACALATFLVMAVGLLNYFVLTFRGCFGSRYLIQLYSPYPFRMGPSHWRMSASGGAASVT